MSKVVMNRIIEISLSSWLLVSWRLGSCFVRLAVSSRLCFTIPFRSCATRLRLTDCSLFLLVPLRRPPLKAFFRGLCSRKPLGESTNGER